MQFDVVYESRKDAEAVREDAVEAGAAADIEEEAGLLPLAVLLVVAVPPGLALLITVIDRVIHGWRDHGIVIDARGTGAPRIMHERDLPYGTVVILTRDGDTATRSDLPPQKLSGYLSVALSAIAQGASASAASQLAAT